MTDSNKIKRAQRAAKRAEIDLELSALRDQLAEARVHCARASDEFEACKEAIRRIDAEMRYRTAPGKSVIDAKAEALALVALGTQSLEEARAVEGGTYNKMSLSELNTAIIGLKRSQYQHELTLRDAKLRVRLLGNQVLEKKCAIAASEYDDAVDDLVERWADLRAYSMHFSARSLQQPIWLQAWNQLRIPLHQGRPAAIASLSQELFRDGSAVLCGGGTNAAERRIDSIVAELGVS